jgi:hypothetical protein
MASWITTKQLLLLQGANPLDTINPESAALGHPPANMDILWDQQCTTTGVKMSTSWTRLVNASWTPLSFSLTIIRCHSCLLPTDCSWQPTTCHMHYKTLIQRYHSLTSGMKQSQRSRHWRKFSNSNLKNLRFRTFQLPQPRSLSLHASPKHPL